VAVLGSGLACIYPSENKQLAEQIAQQGALMSEFSMATPPDRPHFPQRNRIVSGMTMGTLLIEAPQQSGAMLTTARALDQGRPVFALPGRIDQESFKGNHTLIKEGQAKLIDQMQDILQHFDDFSLPLVFKPAVRSSLPLEKEEADLLHELPTQELSVEDILRKTQWPVAKVNGLLMSLVLKKMVKEYPGKIYKKI
jgi:DNA processing protein